MRLDAWLKRNVTTNWITIHKLLKKKKIFLLAANELGTSESQMAIQDAKYRKRMLGKERLDSNQCIYYPKSIINKIENDIKPVIVERKLISSNTNIFLKTWVIYKDSDFLVLNKPYGISTYENRNKDDIHVIKMLNELKFSMDELPKCLHRLPLNSSGALMLARTRYAASMCMNQIQNGLFWRWCFWIVIPSIPHKSKGNIRIGLKKSHKGDYYIPKAIHEGGKWYSANWKLLKVSRKFGGFSLVEFQTHSPHVQIIRALAAYGLQCPIHQDLIYAHLLKKWYKCIAYLGAVISSLNEAEKFKLCTDFKEELHLHARCVLFKTFAGKEITVCASLPPHMDELLKLLGWEEFVKEEEKKAAIGNPWSVENDPHLSTLENVFSEKSSENFINEKSNIYKSNKKEEIAMYNSEEEPEFYGNSQHNFNNPHSFTKRNKKIHVGESSSNEIYEDSVEDDSEEEKSDGDDESLKSEDEENPETATSDNSNWVSRYYAEKKERRRKKLSSFISNKHNSTENTKLNSNYLLCVSNKAGKSKIKEKVFLNSTLKNDSDSSINNKKDIYNKTTEEPVQRYLSRSSCSSKKLVHLPSQTPKLLTPLQQAVCDAILYNSQKE